MIVTVDTGGTKTLVAGFDRDKKPKHEHRFETPQNPQRYLDVLEQAIAISFDPKKIKAISVAVPGVVNDGIIDWCGHLPWKHLKIKKALEERFKKPVFVENDANLAGLAEANALTPVPHLSLYITVSTGIGTGITLNGKLAPELSGSEGGHMLIEYDGKLRTWESFASGRAIHETYGKYAFEIEDERIWHTIADNIARGLLTIIPMLQPSDVIIGGSIGTHYSHYSENVKKILHDTLPEHIIRPKLHKAAHPQEAVIYGCYHHAVNQLARK